MPNPQVSRVMAVLERHAGEMCRSAYTEEAPARVRHCLLGWMAIDAGISLPPAEYRTHVVGMSGTLHFAGELEREYGLSLKQLKQLQFANDDSPDMLALASKVAGALNGPDED